VDGLDCWGFRRAVADLDALSGGRRRDRASGDRELRLSLDPLAVTGQSVVECIDGHLRREARRP
jgi:hypothetical protein